MHRPLTPAVWQGQTTDAKVHFRIKVTQKTVAVDPTAQTGKMLGPSFVSLRAYEYFLFANEHCHLDQTSNSKVHAWQLSNSKVHAWKLVIVQYLSGNFPHQGDAEDRRRRPDCPDR